MTYKKSGRWSSARNLENWTPSMTHTKPVSHILA
jgi:hypothetical protein